MDNQSAPDTRTRILQAASRLFYSRGIRPVSMDEVASAAGLTKRSVYYHFASKDDLVVAYLRYRDRGELRAAAMRRGTDPREQILAVFSELEGAFSNTKFRGCAFVNAAAEFGDSESVRAVATAMKETTRIWLEDLGRELGARDPRALSEQLGLLIEGSLATWLVRRDPAAAARARDAATVLLDSACAPAA
jgi:AcrR family transcriptional regulator